MLCFELVKDNNILRVFSFCDRNVIVAWVSIFFFKKSKNVWFLDGGTAAFLCDMCIL